MTIAIEHVRASWIRALSLPALVGADKIPGPNVGSVASYLAEYDASARQGARWHRPWDGESSHSKLWKRNLGRINYGSVNAGVAWKRMVPLWSNPGVPIAWSGESTAVITADRFLLPGAVAVVLTADFTGSFDFGSALAKVIHLESEKSFRLQDDNSLRLSEVHDRLLKECQQRVLGALDDEADGDTEPLVIVSVLGASGSAEDAVVKQDNPVHRFLAGVCARDVAALGKPASVPLAAALTLSARSEGSTMLAWHRRRALWSPAKMFSPESQAKLDCYHHNLVVSSAITECLLAFMTTKAASRKGQAGFDISKQAAIMLGELYGPSKGMWSSASIRYQIDGSGAVPVINDVRRQHNWSELSARGSPESADR